MSRNKIEDILQAQNRIRAQLRQDEDELQQLTLRQNQHVATARRLGLRWTEIADAIGVPRTTARNRFVGYVEQVSPTKKPHRPLPS